MSVLVNVRVDAGERDAWKAAAAEAGLSMSEFVRLAVAVRMGRSAETDSVGVGYVSGHGGYVSPLRPRGFKPDWKPGSKPGGKAA